MPDGVSSRCGVTRIDRDQHTTFDRPGYRDLTGLTYCGNTTGFSTAPGISHRRTMTFAATMGDVNPKYGEALVMLTNSAMVRKS